MFPRMNIIDELLAVELPCCQMVNRRICGQPARMTNGIWIFCTECGNKVGARMMTNAEHVSLVLQAQEPSGGATSSPA